MFKKIVSRLSLSPSAVSELAFYARRLKQERVTRTFSAVAALLVISLQFLVITAPPDSSNAAGSPSDIIHGGVVSKDDILNKYDARDATGAELRTIFTRLGITRADIASPNTKKVWISSTDHTLQSLSRIDHGNASKLVIGSKTYYYRPLYYADRGIISGSKYEVFAGKRSFDGGYFAVMMLCGNLVFRTVPPLPKPAPAPTPAPKPTPLPTATPKPVIGLACTMLTGSSPSGETPLSVDFTASGTATNQTIAAYLYDFGDGTSLTSTAATSSHTYAKVGNFLATVRIKGSAGTVTPVSAPCSYAIATIAPPAEFTKEKSALNLTQNIDATAKDANAGDVIRYTLVTKNVGKATEPYTVVEHVEDILEYADVTDVGGGALENGVITWPVESIKPGATLVKTFAITVGKLDAASGKRVIPTTPVSTSDPYSFDLRMDNVYGNLVKVQIAPPLPKQIEVVNNSLPATGPATSTLITLIVTGLGIFFYFRNRQLITEVKMLRHDYQGGSH